MQEEAEVEWKAQREMTDERLKELEVLGECELKFGPFAEDDTSPNPFKSIKKALGSTIERVSKKSHFRQNTTLATSERFN